MSKLQKGDKVETSKICFLFISEVILTYFKQQFYTLVSRSDDLDIISNMALELLTCVIVSTFN